MNGTYLKVSDGFDSDTFLGGNFSFFVSEIKNPFTTAVTAPFGIQVYDKNGFVLY